ncbi:ATP-binding protein [Kitasatospora sp. NPDC098652]|uniref:ATP-binding protein n=1 Tax=Kitasatospora sp. NPDC098652 TaxID=3364095 RepID=UPI0037F332C5
MRHLNTPSLALGRQALQDAMVRLGWPASTIFEAELCLYELLVNAWRHGATPAPVVQILAMTRNTLRVSVSDESPLFPGLHAPSVLAESGRGLQLVEGLTTRWGVDPREHGKSIWFELDGAQ